MSCAFHYIHLITNSTAVTDTRWPQTLTRILVHTDAILLPFTVHSYYPEQCPREVHCTSSRAQLRVGVWCLGSATCQSGSEMLIHVRLLLSVLLVVGTIWKTTAQGGSTIPYT